MPHAARAAARTLSTYHQHLPGWITADAGYARLRAGPRQTLQAIASRADCPGPSGDLLHAFGGQALAASAGCSVRTLWRHIATLERLGYVVTIGRGGNLGPRAYANSYAVPGQRGSLDGRRAPLRREPGRQLEIPHQGPDPRDKMARPPVTKWHTTISLNESPLKDHGVKTQRSEAVSRGRPRIGQVSEEDLGQPARLLELYEQATARGYLEASEADRLRFFAAAAHARRVATRNPAGLFVATVKARRWLFLTQADEDVGAAGVKLAVNGTRSTRRRVAVGPDTSPEEFYA